MNKSPNDALIALGANVPQAPNSLTETLSAALARLSEMGDSVAACSRFFETPCFPEGAGPDYVNAVALLRTDRDPAGLLKSLHAVEREFGRTREERWGRRTLDLDLLAFGDLILPDAATFQSWADLAAEDQARRAPERLILPHPRLHERAFVLIPLLDIAPNWRHPVSGLSVAEMADRLPEADKSAIKPL